MTYIIIYYETILVYSLEIHRTCSPVYADYLGTD